MSEKIGRYELLEPLTNVNAGNCRWTFGKRNNEEYFLKELLVPVYPCDDQGFSDSSVQRKRKLCQDFEQERSLIFRQIDQCSDGNLLRIEQLFRYGSKYYVVTKKVHDEGPEALTDLRIGQRMLVCQILAHSIASLHDAGLVHGDLKLSNIAFYKTEAANRLSAKIIDVDGCYWASNPPTDPDSVMTDQVYMAPEVFLLIRDEEGIIGQPADVFSLALCMHLIIAGNVPDHEGYSYAYQAVLDGKKLGMSDSIPPWFRDILSHMLLEDPAARPTMRSVFRAIRQADPNQLSNSSAKGSETPSRDKPVERTKTGVIEIADPFQTDYGFDSKPTPPLNIPPIDPTPPVHPAPEPVNPGASTKLKIDPKLLGLPPDESRSALNSIPKPEKPLPTSMEYWFSAPGDL